MNQIVPFSDFGGLELLTTGPTALPNRARYVRNIQKRKGEALIRRQGCKIIASNEDNNGGFGTFAYKRSDDDDLEILVAGSRLFRRKPQYFTITYAGAGSAVARIMVVDGVWRFYIVEDGTDILDMSLEVGYDEASPVTISDLIAAIDALTDFACTGTASDEPAAFIPFFLTEEIATTLQIDYWVSEEVNHPTGADDPWTNTYLNRSDLMFENITSIQGNGIILFGSKYDWQIKYDGVDCYRSGLPTPAAPVLTESSPGPLTAGVYKYIILFVQVDAAGNRIESIESASTTITVAGATASVFVDVTPIQQDSGFNTDVGRVDATGMGLSTIQVNNSTLKAGQTAYMYDTTLLEHVEKEILTATASEITIDGTVDLSSLSEPISNNLRIMVFRTAVGGSIYSYVGEFPNNSLLGTQRIVDTVSDANLGADYVSPGDVFGTPHTLAPKGAYIAMYQDIPVIAGMVDSPNSFQWASANESLEYYPPLYSDFIVGDNSRPITALVVDDRYLWLHKSNESHLLTGNLLTGQYAVNQRSNAVGCISQSSVARSDRGVFWLGDGAVYRTLNGSTPERISDDIGPVFDNAGVRESRQLHFLRSVGVYDRKNQYYILYMPAERESGAERYPTTSSRIFAFDAKREDWWEWDFLNMAGGAVYVDGEMFWTERYYSTFDATMQYKLWGRIESGTNYDYVDHVDNIAWSYKAAGWVHLGQPSVHKKITHIIPYCFDSEKSANYDLVIKTEKNFIIGVYDSQLTIPIGSGSGGGSGFGIDPFGSFPFGNPSSGIVESRRLKHGICTALRFEISGGDVYDECVFNMKELQVSAPFKIDINKTAAA